MNTKATNDGISSNDGAGDTWYSNLSYFYWNRNTGWFPTKKYVEVSLFFYNEADTTTAEGDCPYDFFGIAIDSNGNDQGRTRTMVSGSRYYYFYKDQYSTNKSDASSGIDTWINGGNNTRRTYNFIFRKRYHVYYKNNYGSLGGWSSLINAGIGFTLDKGPTRTGYTFLGWSGSVTGTTYTTSVADSNVSGDFTYYAQWQANRYKVTLSPNFPGTAGSSSGGKWSDGSTYCYACYDSKNFYTTSSSSTTAKPQSTSCTGYTFSGWANSDGTILINSSGTLINPWNITSDTTLYGSWVQNTYTITLNTNSGSGGSPGSVTATYYNTGSWSITAPTRTNYVFAGWTTTQNGETILINTSGKLISSISGYTDASGRWTKTESVTVYALWRPKAQTLTLNANGGTFPYNAGVSGVTVTNVSPNVNNYGFKQVFGTLYSGSGYFWESQNKNVSNSYSMCRVDFSASGGIEFKIYNYAESNYDYAILSNLNTPLEFNATADTKNVHYSFKGKSSASWQSVIYQFDSSTTKNYFIYIKFIKDGTGNNNNDSVRFYSTTSYTVSENSSTVGTSITNYGFTTNSQGFYESQNKEIHNSFALTRVCFTTTSTNAKISFAVIKNGEGADHGYFSLLDTMFSATISTESSSKYNRDVGNSTSLTVVTYTIPLLGQHFIDIKYYKNGSVNTGYDSLQFMILDAPNKLGMLYNQGLSTNPNASAGTPTRSGYTFNGYSNYAFGPQTNGNTIIISPSGYLNASKSGYTDSSSRWIRTSDTELYANWTPRYATIQMRMYVSENGKDYALSTNGGRITVSYTRAYMRSYDSPYETQGGQTYVLTSSSAALSTLLTYSVSISASTLSDYHFVGFRYGTGSAALSTVTGTNSTMSTTSTTYSTTYTTETTLWIYAYFKKDNEIYKDTSSGLYYVDYGYVPQTAYTSITSSTMLNSNFTYFGLSGALYKGNDTTSSGNYYFLYRGIYYKFEKIKWRLIPDNENQNYTSRGVADKNSVDSLGGVVLVSDKVLFGAKFSTTELGAGDSYYDSSLYSLLTTLNNTSTIGSGSNTLDTGFNSSTIMDQYWDEFSSDLTSPNKVVMHDSGGWSSVTNLRVVGASQKKNRNEKTTSYYEDEVLGKSSSYSASCTDFAIMLLGKEKGLEVSSYSSFEQFANAVLELTNASSGEYKNHKVDYWTRNLGTYTNEAKVIGGHNEYTGLNMQSAAGVRLAYTLSSATNFGKTI